MLIKSFALAIIIGLLSFSLAASEPAAKDSIKGDWSAVFLIAGQTADANLKFDVHHSKLTGTIFSEHTGPGTISDGKWKDGKLTCTFKFEKHESIAVSGTLKDGKLTGEFKTEGMSGTWTASRK
ncbi:MAG: hypothetical protein ACRD43_11520 [Pyrinomonadaceae bacterium]